MIREQNFKQLKFDIQGHRGCVYQPENTLPAFVEALNMGATSLEMDVIVSKDKKVIVEHFNSLLQTCIPPQDYMGPYHISELDYDTIKEFDPGMNTRKISLEETLESLSFYHPYPDLHPVPIKYFIEMKSIWEYNKIKKRKQPTIKSDEYVELIYEIIERLRLIKQSVLMSFDHRLVDAAQKTHENLKTTLLAFSWKEFRTKLRKIKKLPNYCGIQQTHISVAAIEWAHSAGMKVIPWTVNNKKRAKQLKDWGCDGIATDFPDMMADLVEYSDFPKIDDDEEE